MTNETFYDLIESESTDLSVAFENNEYYKKQDENGKKSFLFLIWFLKNYLPEVDIFDLENFVTEGPDDSSSDIIFSNKNQSGEETYYVVQAKWFSKDKINKANGITKEVKACMTDFKLMLTGNKKPSEINTIFNIQYSKFIKHKKENKKIKFIFLTLCSRYVDITDLSRSFSNNELVSFDLFDLSRLKKNYIEIIYKGIKTHNPLEEPYNPILKIDLQITPQKMILIENPFKSHIFLIKPDTIFNLFDKFGNSIFYKNIRNPLPKSLYNEGIQNTILNNPKNFWYFNNGITAITDKIGSFHDDADNVSIQGLQVINGAQTIYNVYDAYKNAPEIDRRKMNENTLITIRVVETGGKDFDLSITRYTNSQNPISERDFHSNDDVQKRLQDDFLKNTNIWYETRQGEFTQKHSDSYILTNEVFGQLYLAYFVNDPLSAKQKRRLIFQSNKIKPDGLYELIFNEKTNYEDMLVAYKLHLFIENKRKDFKNLISDIDTTRKLTRNQTQLLKFDFIQYSTFEILALFKLLLQKTNKDTASAVNKKLINFFEKDDLKLIESSYNFITDFILKDLEIRKKKNSKIVNSVLFKNREYYPSLSISFKDFIGDSKKIKKIIY